MDVIRMLEVCRKAVARDIRAMRSRLREIGLTGEFGRICQRRMADVIRADAGITFDGVAMRADRHWLRERGEALHECVRQGRAVPRHHLPCGTQDMHAANEAELEAHANLCLAIANAD